LKKKQRMLLMLLGVLVVLGGAIFALTTFTEDPDAKPDGYIPVSHERADIAAITVTNTFGSFTVTRDESLPAGYYCEDIEGLPQLGHGSRLGGGAIGGGEAFSQLVEGGIGGVGTLVGVLTAVAGDGQIADDVGQVGAQDRGTVGRNGVPGL